MSVGTGSVAKPMGEVLDAKTAGAEFVRLNRALTWAEDFEAWQAAAGEIDAFLDKVDTALHGGRVQAWSHSDSARLFSILLTLMAEAGQYRHETYPTGLEEPRYRMLTEQLLPGMGRIRQRAIALGKLYLSQPVFQSLAASLETEIFPLLDSMDPVFAPDRFMPFRVVQVGNIAERLLGFQFRTDDVQLIGDGKRPGLLREIYNRKYLRFGTSGVRGRWLKDFTDRRAKQVVQAACEFLRNIEVPKYVGGEDLSGKRVVVGYDSRLNARTVAQWATEVILANGFTVDLCYRDSPTPALVYYLTDYLDPGEVAGLINLTASHNPPEWQGIKFNPRLGYPAPTNITDFIASRINELQLLDREIPTASMEEAEAEGRLRGFDPIDSYVQYVLSSGEGNGRIKLDWERMRKYFEGQPVVIDEMHGAGRGYLSRLLAEIGIRHTVIHGQVNPTLPGLDYANPEEPFIDELKQKVKETGAVFGGGTDTDADRYGVVDRSGMYYRPNQILPMLVRYLGADRQEKGRVVATQTGSPLNEVLAGMIEDNEENRPAPGVIPAYVDHPFYRLRVGDRSLREYKNAFMVPVGIKYIEEIRRCDRHYRGLKVLPPNWRDLLLIGGEESSGLTSRGHICDKDGIWANLLIMDMLAYYGTRAENPLHGLGEIWEETCRLPGCWVSYGGREPQGSNTGRSDIDAILEAKEDLIDYYLDLFADKNAEKKLAGLNVIYAGGVRYDISEMQFRDDSGDDRHYLRMRSSGTEPINRVYVESSRSETAKRLMDQVLAKLEELIARELRRAQNEWRLVDIIAVTKLSPRLVDEAKAAISERGWSQPELVHKLRRVVEEPGYLEARYRRETREWIKALGG